MVMEEDDLPPITTTTTTTAIRHDLVLLMSVYTNLKIEVSSIVLSTWVQWSYYSTNVAGLTYQS